MNSQTSIKAALGFSLMVTLFGCGGGGGGGDGSTGAGGGSGNSSLNFTASLAAINLEDTRTGQQVVVNGLPVAGAIVTQN